MNASPHEIAFWTLEGTIGEDSFAWSTLPAAGYEDRLEGPPEPFRLGASSTLGSAPEKTSTSVVLANADGGLDEYFIGTTGGGPATEFLSASLLTLRAKVYRVTVAGGSRTKKAYTGTLVATAVSATPGQIRLSLAADDEGLLGPSKKLRTVRSYIEDPSATVISDPWYAGAYLGSPPSPPQVLWDALVASATENLDTQVPWTYGLSPFQRIAVSSDDTLMFFIGVVIPETYLSRLALRSPPGTEAKSRRRAFVVSFSSGEHLLCFATDENDRGDDDTDGGWVIPYATGGSLVEAGRGVYRPMEVIRDLLEDHTEAGASSYDAASLAATNAELGRYTGAIGGILGTGAPLSEVLECIAPAIGLRVWIGQDDKLHFAARDLSLERIQEQMLTATRIQPIDDLPISTDDFPSWEEAIPAAPDDIGAAVSKVTIDWPGWAVDLYPRKAAPDEATVERSPRLGLVELRLRGDWIHPAAGREIVQSVSDRAAYPVRAITLVTHLSVVDEIGKVVLVSSPHGIGEWQDRPARVLGVQVRPADEAAVVFLEDLGPIEALRAGLLDSAENWIAFDPAYSDDRDDLTITFHEGVAYLYGLETPVPPGLFEFTEDHVGMTLWGPPSIHPDHLGVTSYRVLSHTPQDEGYVVEDGAGVVIWPPYSQHSDPPKVIPVPGPYLDVLEAPWLLMQTYTREGKDSRPGYIAGADPATGKFSDNDPAFQFVRS